MARTIRTRTGFSTMAQATPDLDVQSRSGVQMSKTSRQIAVLLVLAVVIASGSAAALYVTQRTPCNGHGASQAHRRLVPPVATHRLQLSAEQLNRKNGLLTRAAF